MRARPFVPQALAVTAALAFAFGLSDCRRQEDVPRAAGESPVPAKASTSPTIATDRTVGALPSLAPLVKLVRPAAVNINCTFSPRLVRGIRAPYLPRDFQGLQADEREEDPMDRFRGSLAARSSTRQRSTRCTASAPDCTSATGWC